MRNHPPIRLDSIASSEICHPERSAAKSKDLWLLFLFPLIGIIFLCLCCLPAQLKAQTVPQIPAPPQPAKAVVLDHVVAVVNNQAILASDVDDEIRLAVLDTARAGMGVLTPRRALEQLISRALIQQQIRQEDAQAIEPTQAEIDARLGQIRKEVPACVHLNCASEEGWKAFLATHELNPERVRSYLRFRIQILRFIEERFRQGIHIAPEEIESYYKETLLPQYAAGETTPILEEVAPRIQEILLQRQVNALFDDWLKNLRKQGDVEVLDPSLEAPQTPSGAELSTPLHLQDEKGGA
jgi:peptidyl-prolyl cis-trans isomerase SurA